MPITLTSPSYTMVPRDGVMRSRDPDGDGLLEGIPAVIPERVTLASSIDGVALSKFVSSVTGDPIGYQAWLTWLNNNAYELATWSVSDEYYNNHSQVYWQEYDGIRCQRFVGERMGQVEPYRTARITIRDSYINDYIVRSNYSPTGYYQYPVGLYEEYMIDGHQPSISAIDGWLDSTPWTWNESNSYRHQIYSREIAYGMLSLVLYEHAVGVGNTNLTALGKDAGDRYPWLLTCMEHHLYQWRNNDFSDPPVSRTNYAYMNPFMVAITAYCLARYHDAQAELRGDGNLHWPTGNWPSIPAALEDVLSWMMDEAVVPDGSSYAGNRIWRTPVGGYGGGAFYYIDRSTSGIGGPGNPAPDLNMLIAPGYAWVAKTLGNAAWITDRADLLFAGGIGTVTMGSPGGWAKRINQQLVWTKDYFNWRAML